MSLPHSLLIVIAALALTGCKALGKFDFPDLPPIDFGSLGLPTDSEGNVVLFETPNGRLALDPTKADPITAVGNCTDLITNCYAPPTRDLDACVASAPVCKTQRPWEESEPCCPSRCSTDYDRERDDGLAPHAAFARTYFDEPDCFPGVRQAIGGSL